MGGGGGPTNIIFGFTGTPFGWTPIDHRLPALSEGPLWPELFRFYTPGALAGQLVVLHRRREPLPDLLGTEVSQRARLGRWVTLPRNAGPLFLSIALQRTLPGRALSLLYKPGLTFIETETAGGQRSIYRLIPAIARLGFVLSPQITKTTEFRDLACGKEQGLESVRHFRVFAQKSPINVYYKTYDYSERHLNLSPLRTACVPARPGGRSKGG